MDLGFTSYAAITVVCFLVSEIAKMFGIDKSRIPVVCGIVGCMFGVVSWMFVSGFPANNWLDAMAIGIVSGLAATGAHQTYKQLKEG